MHLFQSLLFVLIIKHFLSDADRRRRKKEKREKKEKKLKRRRHEMEGGKRSAANTVSAGGISSSSYDPGEGPSHRQDTAPAYDPGEGPSHQEDGTSAVSSKDNAPSKQEEHEEVNIPQTDDIPIDALLAIISDESFEVEYSPRDLSVEERRQKENSFDASDDPVKRIWSTLSRADRYAVDVLDRFSGYNAAIQEAVTKVSNVHSTQIKWNIEKLDILSKELMQVEIRMKEKLSLSAGNIEAQFLWNDKLAKVQKMITTVFSLKKKMVEQTHYFNIVLPNMKSKFQNDIKTVQRDFVRCKNDLKAVKDFINRAYL